jgi:fructoselysine 6-kinase
VAADFDLATVGDNCIDRYLAPVGASTVGGNAVNVAAHLAARGHRVAYAGAVGDDADGRRVVAALRAAGVATGLVRVVAGGRTATSDIQTGPDGERVIGPEDFGVCRGYRPDAETVAALLGSRHVHIGWLDDGGAVRRHLVASGVAVSQDLAVNADARDLGAESLAPAFASATTPDEGEALARRLLEAGARLAVITCGRSGSLASDGTMVARVGAAPARIVDTLGAGDTFIAAFIAGRVRGLDLQACLEAGRDAAALTCAHLGGFPQTPVALA